MGQKVNPYGFRLGIVTDWKSRWFADREYTDYLTEDVRIRKYLDAQLRRAAVSRVEIERTRDRLRVDLYTARPGIVIGRRGAEADRLRAGLLKITGNPKTPQLTDCDTVLEPHGYRVGPGEIFARQVDEVVDGCLTGNLRWCCGVLRSAGQAGACWSGLGRGSPCQRIEGAVDGGLGDVGEAEVVAAGVSPQPGEGLVQMEAGAF